MSAFTVAQAVLVSSPAAAAVLDAPALCGRAAFSRA
jgi:hypothetical protein